MTEQLSVPTPEAMHALGTRIGAVLRPGDLVVLDGPLGAGKTTLTRGIGAAVGVRGPVTSPTFVLARTHPSLVGGPALTHVDAYRLGSAAELDDLDLDLTGTVVVVEWGAGLLDGVAPSVLTVRIRRPTGRGPADREPADEGPAEYDAAGEGPADQGPADDARDDVSADDDAAPVEPREVTLTATGPRWAATAWATPAE